MFCSCFVVTTEVPPLFRHFYSLDNIRARPRSIRIDLCSLLSTTINGVLVKGKDGFIGEPNVALVKRYTRTKKTDVVGMMLKRVAVNCFQTQGVALRPNDLNLHSPWPFASTVLVNKVLIPIYSSFWVAL